MTLTEFQKKFELHDTGIINWRHFPLDGRLSIEVEYCNEVDPKTQKTRAFDGILEFQGVKNLVINPPTDLNNIIDVKQSAQFFSFKMQPDERTFEMAVLVDDYIAKTELFVVVYGSADSVTVLNKASLP